MKGSYLFPTEITTMGTDLFSAETVKKRSVPETVISVEKRYDPFKPPVWTWEVPLYFFVGGTAGAAALLAAVAGWRAQPSIAHDARWIAAAGAILSPPLLIADLGRPARFLNMLRVFKLQSPMSIGAWTLVVFSIAAIGALISDELAMRVSDGPIVVTLATTTSAIAAATGLVMATYSGVLIGATAIPVWSSNVRLLPVLFSAASLGAAVSILELLGHRTSSLNTIGVFAAAIDTVIAATIEIRRGRASEALFTGSVAWMSRTGAVVAGPLPLVLRLVSASSTPARTTAALCMIAGSLITRVTWLTAARQK